VGVRAVTPWHNTMRRVMRNRGKRLAIRSWFTIALAALALLFGRSQARCDEVTLKGSVVCNGACIPDPKEGDHDLVLFAIDGTAEIRATVERIVKDYYPDRGLDAAAVQKLMDQFSRRLKYHVVADSPALKKMNPKGKGHYCMPATANAVTGTV